MTGGEGGRPAVPEGGVPVPAGLLWAYGLGAGVEGSGGIQGYLPAEPDSFIGRDRELGELRRLLPGTRALTLCGPGGVGRAGTGGLEQRLPGELFPPPQDDRRLSGALLLSADRGCCGCSG